MQSVLERHIRRLDMRIANLGASSRSYSWIRLFVLLLGGLVVWAVSEFAGPVNAWAAFFIALGVFSGVALAHRRLDGWIERFQIWRDLKAERLARLSLDWDRIPFPLLPHGAANRLGLDLDLVGERSLHHLINQAVSRDGSALLADWLSQPVPHLDTIYQRQAVVRELVPLSRFRDRLVLSFRLVTKEALDGEKLLRWLQDETSLDRLKWAIPIAAVLIVINIILFVLHGMGRLPPYWALTGLVYVLFYYLNAGALGNFMEAIVRLDEELAKFRAILKVLETQSFKGQENLARLCQPFRDPENLPSVQLRKVRLVTAAIGLRMNFVIGLLLNLIFPWDFTFAYLAGRSRKMLSASLPAWFHTWNKLEALISLANFASLNPGYAFPDLVLESGPVYQAASLGHPLIPPAQRVCNDFTIRSLGEVEVITGSNMAGKSTFIKTVGVNLCLAYAGGPVCASMLHCMPFRLHTCIRIADSLSDGYSYFYAEVRCLKELLESLKKDDPFPLLYLIDEIFRGTNNRERLIGSRSYIKEVIGQKGVGLLATHDLELASLSEASSLVKNYHFRDSVQEGKLIFDYKIHPGPSPTTNALVIMRQEGLPVDM